MHEYVAGKPFYLRRDGKMKTLHPEVLLRAYQKNQFRPGDLIRQSGEREWRDFANIDWENVARICQSTADLPDKSNKSEQPRVAVTTSVKKAAVEDRDQGWWSESPSQPSRVASGNKVRRWSLIGLLMICSLGIGYFLFFQGQPNSTAQQSSADSSSREPLSGLSNANSTAEDEGAAVQEQQSSVGEVSPNPANFNGESNSDQSSLPFSQVEQESQFPSEANASETEDIVELDAAKPTTEGTDQGNPDQGNPKSDSAEPLEPNAKPGSASQFDKVELASSAYNSKSAEIESKSDLDNLFDLTAALLDFYVATTKDLRENQQRFNDYVQSISGLETYLAETTAMVTNARAALVSAQLLVASIDAEVRAFGAAGRDQMLAKRKSAMAEINLLNAKLKEAQETFPAKQRELSQKRDGLQNVKKQLVELSTREGEYITRLLSDLDMYGEKPRAYHERLKLLTEKVIPGSPDVLVAHLLSGYSALVLNDLETAQRAVIDLRKQLELLPQVQRELRSRILVRYQTLGDLIDATRCSRSQEPDEAQKWLQLAKTRDAHFADVWLTSGLQLSERGKFKEARPMFDRAIRLEETDTRVQRVALRSLLGHEQVPTPVIKSLSDGLAAKAGAADWQSWKVVCDAFLQLDDKSNARAAFNRIKKNSWNAEQIEILRQKIESAGQ